MKSIEDALGRLEGVSSAKMGRMNAEYVVRVSEKKVLARSTVQKAIQKAGFFLTGVVIEAEGTVEKSGEEFVFVARASGQKYALNASDYVKKLAADGKPVAVKGKLTEPKEGVFAVDVSEPKPSGEKKPEEKK